MSDHRHFEVLCTLAATGQLGGRELVDFTDHCIQCSACRRSILDIAEVSSRLLPLGSPGCDVPSGMGERFVARARREGVPISPSAAPSVSLPTVFGLTLVALAALVAVFQLAPPSRLDGNAERPASMSQGAVPIADRQSVSHLVSPSTMPGRKGTPVHFLGRRVRKPALWTGRRAAAPEQPVAFSMYVPAAAEQVTSVKRVFKLQSVSSWLGGPPGPQYVGTGLPSYSTRLSTHLIQPEKPDGSGERVFRFDGRLARLEFPQDLVVEHPRLDFTANVRPLRFQIPTAQ